jgi:hypothetical protein
MRYFGVPLDQALIKAAKRFHSAQGISDYFGVSLPTLYSWIRSYHGLSFRQFKRKYICANRSCIVIDHCAQHYAWKYTVADRVHDRGGCICFVEGSENLIMTTLLPSDVSEILHAEVVEDDAGVYAVRQKIDTDVRVSSNGDCDGDDEDDAGSAGQRDHRRNPGRRRT